MSSTSRILSITLLFLAMLAGSPLDTRAQLPQDQRPLTECDKIQVEMMVEMSQLASHYHKNRVANDQMDEIDAGRMQGDKARLAAERTRWGMQYQLSQEKIERLFKLLRECACEECRCPKETSRTQEPSEPPGYRGNDFITNQILALASTIREDSSPRFNTYGVNGAYTRFINPSVGITGDFNAHFRERNGTDLSKLSALGGVTFVPFEGAKTSDKATVSLHALVGVSRFKADSGVASFTDNAATVKIGGAVDVNAFSQFFIRAGQVDYAPTWFGGEVQHNFQVGFGAGIRWK